ncbi:MAG: hypothetical protein GX903_11925 [Spirochaetales bacterium]|nr:hypothetical protein [Spirochaetales bacterium]
MKKKNIIKIIAGIIVIGISVGTLIYLNKAGKEQKNEDKKEETTSKADIVIIGETKTSEVESVKSEDIEIEPGNENDGSVLIDDNEENLDVSVIDKPMDITDNGPTVETETNLNTELKATLELLADKDTDFKDKYDCTKEIVDAALDFYLEEVLNGNTPILINDTINITVSDVCDILQEYDFNKYSDEKLNDVLTVIEYCIIYQMGD